MEKFIIIVLIIILIITLSKIRIIVYKNINEKLNFKVYILPKLGIKFKLNKLLSRYKNQTFTNMLMIIINEVKNIEDRKKFCHDFLRIINVRSIKINYYYDYLKYPSSYVYLLAWLNLSYIKSLLDKYTNRVDKEDYNVIISSNINDAYIHVDFVFPILSFIYILIKNFKVIIKGIIKHGTSNKRTIKTFGRKYY